MRGGCQNRGDSDIAMGAHDHGAGPGRRSRSARPSEGLDGEGVLVGCAREEGLAAREPVGRVWVVELKEDLKETAEVLARFAGATREVEERSAQLGCGANICS